MVHAPSSVRRGQGLLVECGTSQPLNAVERVTWGVIATKNRLCSYYPRSTEGSMSCLQGRALTWLSGNSSYLYLNSTRLSDSGNYTCNVKIKNQKLMTAYKTVVVTGEYILI